MTPIVEPFPAAAELLRPDSRLFPMKVFRLSTLTRLGIATVLLALAGCANFPSNKPSAVELPSSRKPAQKAPTPAP